MRLWVILEVTGNAIIRRLLVGWLGYNGALTEIRSYRARKFIDTFHIIGLKNNEAKVDISRKATMFNSC